MVFETPIIEDLEDASDMEESKHNTQYISTYNMGVITAEFRIVYADNTTSFKPALITLQPNILANTNTALDSSNVGITVGAVIGDETTVKSTKKVLVRESLGKIKVICQTSEVINAKLAKQSKRPMESINTQTNKAKKTRKMASLVMV
jgi:hypothetical protein